LQRPTETAHFRRVSRLQEKALAEKHSFGDTDSIIGLGSEAAAR